MNRFRVAVVCLLACGAVLVAASRHEPSRQCIGIAASSTDHGGAWLYRAFSDGSVQRMYVEPWQTDPKGDQWQLVAPADLEAPAEVGPGDLLPGK